MPIPTPNEKEKRTEFMARCMSNDIMNKEFPENKQRYKVCITSWEKHQNKSSSKSDKNNGDEKTDRP